jgi:hypothetical protein
MGTEPVRSDPPSHRAIVTNQDVIRWLMELGRQLDEATSEMSDLEATAVRAKIAYERAFATAWLAAEGSIDSRKQQTLLTTEKQRLDLYLADAAVHACIERIRTIRARIEIGRALNAAQRSEMGASGLIQV